MKGEIAAIRRLVGHVRSNVQGYDEVFLFNVVDASYRWLAAPHPGPLHVMERGSAGWGLQPL